MKAIKTLAVAVLMACPTLCWGQNDELDDRAQSWDFSILSFSATPKSKKKKSKSHSDVNVGGLGFGFLLPIGEDQRYFDRGSSSEVFINIIDWENKIGRHTMSIGFGMQWRRYCLTQEYRFEQTKHHTTIRPWTDDEDGTLSRLKVKSLTMPLRYSYSAGKHWYIDAGAIINLNRKGSSLLTEWSDGTGGKHKQTIRHLNLHPVTLDLQLNASWHNVGLYAKYSPFSVFRGGYGPKINSASVGMTLFY